MPFAPTTVVLDTFDRADGALGSNWGVPVGSAAVASHQLAPTGGTNDVPLWSATFGAHQEVFATYSVLDGTVSMAVYFNAATFSGYLAGYIAGSTTLHITRIDLGVATTLGTISHALSPGDRLWVYENGSNLELYSNDGSGWTLQLTVTDATYRLAGMKIGLVFSGTTVARIDDVGGGDIAFREVATTAGGSNVYVLTPLQVAWNGTAADIHHGLGGDRSVPYQDLSEVLGLIARGMIVAASDLRGDAWGNQNAIDDAVALHALLAAGPYNVTKAVVYGLSMGGLSAVNTVASRSSRIALGMVGISPALDLAYFDGTGLYAASLAAAYPSGYTAYNPVGQSASTYDRLNFYLIASVDDTTAPKVSNADVFAALVTGHAHEISEVSTTGPHATPVYSVTDILAFLDRIFNPNQVVFRNENYV